MNFEERTRWVNNLLACNAVRDRKVRDDIVDELPQQMRAHIQRSEADNIDVMNILKRILEFDDGLTHFIEIVRFYEGDTQSMKAVNRLYGQAISSDSESEEVALLNQEQTNPPAIDTPDEMNASKHTSLNTSYTAHLGLGNVYREQGKYAEAIATYDRVIGLKPDYVDAYINRGIVYHKQGKYSEAIADNDQAIRLAPDYAIAYHNKGAAYYNQKQYDEAIANYDLAIQFDPNYVDAYNSRGNAYMAQGEHTKALADYERAIELNFG